MNEGAMYDSECILAIGHRKKAVLPNIQVCICIERKRRTYVHRTSRSRVIGRKVTDGEVQLRVVCVTDSRLTDMVDF